MLGWSQYSKMKLFKCEMVRTFELGSVGIW